MSPSVSIAASLSSDVRKDIVIQALSGSTPISHLAKQHQVSRKFVYQQSDKAQALMQWFSHDVLALAGPSLPVRQELYDFIEIALKQRGDERYPAFVNSEGLCTISASSCWLLRVS